MSTGILIENGNVIDGTGAAPETASVLIEGDTILAVGAKADEKAREINDLERIDATGLTVMPGLIDAHCHITFDEPASNDELFFHRREGLATLVAAYNVRKLLLAGVTSFFDADSIFDAGIDLRDAIEGGIVEGPRMSTGGNALMTSLGGTAGRLLPDEGRRGYGIITKTRDEIVAEVRREIKAGVDWIKVHVTGLVPRRQEGGEVQVWTIDELRAVSDTAHDLGIPVVGHCRNASSTRDAALADFDMILHATFMDEEALETVVDRKVPIVPTLTFQANLADYGDRVGADRGLMEVFRQEISGSSAMLKRAYKAGVPMLCGSESGFALTPYGHWHYREMEVFVEHLEMSPLEAIKCGTKDNAFALKLDGKIGVVGEDHLADIIVLDGDPAEDITVLGDQSRLRHVFLGGRAVELDRPQPPRKPIPGWRVSQFAQKILTHDMATNGGGSA